MYFPEIILLKHASTNASMKNIISGWSDDVLNEDVARSEVECLINETRKYSMRTGVYENIHSLFTSALSRTIDTSKLLLEYINKKPANKTSSEFINEKNYGDLTYMCKDDLDICYNLSEINEWCKSFYGKPPNGESMEDVYYRVCAFYDMFIKELLRKICQFPDNKHKIIIISDETPIQCLMSIIENKRMDFYYNLEICNCKGFYYKMTYDGRIIEKRSLPQYRLLQTDMSDKIKININGDNGESIIIPKFSASF